MTAFDGSIVGTTKIIDNRPNSQGWNLVILGDGFQSGELGAYATAVDRFVAVLRATPPFDRVFGQINVFRVDVSSTDSGADNPIPCGGDGATPRTFFDSTFCTFGTPRLLTADTRRVLDAATAEVPEMHVAMVIVNSTVYGGSGGPIAVFSLADAAEEIAMHEMGHTAFGLADEYQYTAGCDELGPGHAGPFEPVEPNVTYNSARTTLKWRALVDTATAVPTTQNPDCSACDTQASPVPAGTVGAFEGAHYVHCGAFRPEFDCKMRNLGQPFCAVCQQAIAADFAEEEREAGCTRTLEITVSQCAQTADQGYSACTRTEDQGYSACAQTADQGYRDCCTWWPCSWACKAWVWVSNIVCVLWTWVSKLVCVAWTWVSNIVCVLWSRVTYVVCLFFEPLRKVLFARRR